MLPEAYEALHAIEQEHWWYVGARAMYKTFLDVEVCRYPEKSRLLEIGCGSGGNLTLLEEYYPTVGVDISFEALKMVPKRPSLGLVQASATALPFGKQVFDGVNLLGVIEHLESDEEGLREAARVTRLEGSILIFTSAFPILWSHHDEANLHKRRYKRKSLGNRIHNAGLVPVRLSYQNFFTFFPTLVIRLWQRRFRSQPHYDMGSPPKIINQFLIQVLKLEAKLIRFISLPFGVDLVALCRPRKGISWTYRK